MTLVGEVTQEPDYEADIAAAKAFQNVTDAVVAQVAVMAVQSEPALKLV